MRVRLFEIVISSAIALSLLGGSVASGLFAENALVADNVLSTAECFTARLKNVQSAEVTISSEGTTTVTITAVDPTRAFLMFTLRSNSTKTGDSYVRGRLASPTTVEFIRNTDNGTPPAVVVRWSVVEYACGITVQRGEKVQDNSTAVTLGTPLKAVNQAFLTWSVSPGRSETSFGSDDPLVGEITGTSTIQFRSDGYTSTHTISWQVIQFDFAADINVQKGTTNMASGSASTNITLPQSVDASRSFALVATRSGGSAVGAKVLRGRITGPTTLNISRGYSTGAVTEITWQVVELREGSLVQSGDTTIASGSSTATPAIDTIDPARTTAFLSGQIVGGQSMGQSSSTGTTLGVLLAELTVSANSLTIQRSNTGSTADFTWYVVMWGGPSWWDNSYDRRIPINVTAASAAANGYSMPVTFDHSTLVANNLSLSNGNDVRVAYWSGSAWTELDRVLDEGSTWNSTSTKLWFRTAAALSAGANMTRYFLYYTNPSATSPPANPDNVWLFWDDFENGLGKWTLSGSGVIAATAQSYSGARAARFNGISGTSELLANGVNEADVLIDAYWYMTTRNNMNTALVSRASSSGATFNGYATRYTEGSSGWDLSRFNSGTTTVMQAAPAGQPTAVDTWTKITTILTGSNMSVLRNGTQILPASGTTNMGTTLTSGSVGLRATVPNGSWFIDDFRARRYTSPEPVTTVRAGDRR